MQPTTETPQRIKLLLSLGKFSQNTQDALLRHFVTGMSIEVCCCVYEILQPNLARSIKRLNEINHVVEQIKQMDLYHLSDKQAA